MFRRWLTSSIFLLPLLLCVAGWGWSVQHESAIGYAPANLYVVGRTAWGAVRLEWAKLESGKTLGEGWACGSRGVPPHFWPPGPPYSYLGFHYDRYVEDTLDGPLTQVRLGAPYWSLLLLFGSLLFLVWRKTRPHPPAGAFPVEVKTTGPA